MNDTDYPALYLAADHASLAAQRLYLNLIRGYSILLMLATGLAIYGIQDRPSAVAAAFVIIVSMAVSVIMILRRDEDTWYRARAVAESVKTIAWRFMMRADPYDDSAGPGEAKARLRDRIKSILAEHKELAYLLGGKVSGQEQITQKMLEVRDYSWQNRLAFYRRYRIDEQRSWYADKSHSNQKRGRAWFSVLFLAQTAAVALVLLRIAAPSFRYWPVEVFVVGAAMALTWIQVKRFRELAAAYGLTAHELGLVRNESDNVESEESLANFVIDGENAFSREHTQWLARKDSR